MGDRGAAMFRAAMIGAVLLGPAAFEWTESRSLVCFAREKRIRLHHDQQCPR